MWKIPTSWEDTKTTASWKDAYIIEYALNFYSYPQAKAYLIKLNLYEDNIKALLKSKFRVISGSTQMFLKYYINKNGEFHGKYKRYYPSGEVSHLTWYHNDKLNGTYIHYRQDGTISSTHHYKNGVLHGETRYYSVCGKSFHTIYYDQGEERVKYY